MNMIFLLNFACFLLLFYLYIFQDIFLFLIFIGIWLIYSIVLVSVSQQHESIIHVHASTLFWILFPYRSLQSSE